MHSSCPKPNCGCIAPSAVFPILATGPSIFLVTQAKQTLESSWTLLLSQSTSDPSVSPAVSTFKTYRNFAHHFFVYHPTSNHHHLFLVYWKSIPNSFRSFHPCFSKLPKVTAVRRHFKKCHDLDLSTSEELRLKAWPPWRQECSEAGPLGNGSL